jgi:hypothetical protein
MQLLDSHVRHQCAGPYQALRCLPVVATLEGCSDRDENQFRLAAEDQATMTDAFDLRSKCRKCPRYNGQGNCVCRRILKGDKLCNENR